MRLIVADFHHLRAGAKAGKWDDFTPVPPSVFGPLDEPVPPPVAPIAHDKLPDEPSNGDRDSSLADEHSDYLRRLVADRVVPSALAEKARRIWLAASASTADGLPVPAASAVPGGPIEYYWDTGPHQLLVEIPADGACHWTYRNRATGEVWGAEIPVEGELPQMLERIIERFTASVPA